MSLEAAIFDLDGVITDTANTHLKSWKKVFEDFLSSYNSKFDKQHLPFTEEDYVKYIDGLSRIDGIKSFLHSRNICLTEKNKHIINDISQKKNKIFLQNIKREGIKLFNSSIQLLKDLKYNKVKIAVISSSENCKKILSIAKITNLFDIIVDGNLSKQLDLKGKPNPDIFIEAAKRLSKSPANCIVIEDALAGIKAAKSGKFGLIIGVDRRKRWHSQFISSGADFVVSDLNETTYDQIKKKFNHLPCSALDNFTAIQNKIDNKHIIIFSDYDGTLCPIVERPELAEIPYEIKKALLKLNKLSPIVIISGRQLSDIQKRIGIDGLYYAGNHGFEIFGPEFFQNKFEKGTIFLEKIKKIYTTIVEALSSIENCLVEYKKFSLSVHYRLVNPSDVKFIKNKIKEILNDYDDIEIRTGKKVFEIFPKLEWDKGKAVLFILSKLKEVKNKNIIPLYIGDDSSDEYALKEVKNIGIGILVSEVPKCTNANYQLRDNNEVYYFFNRLLSFMEFRDQKLHFLQEEWGLEYHDFNPKQQTLREALCTLGNGYFATRGSSEENQADEYNYPGTYFSGCYNQLSSTIAGVTIANEDMVNMPNWLSLTFRIADNLENWLNLLAHKILSFQQGLQMQSGLLRREFSFKDHEGRITHIKSIRFVSMDNPHVATIKFTIQPENWSGKIEIKTGLDGSVINMGVTRYKGLNSKHLEIIAAGKRDNGIFLHMRTNQSHIEIAEVACHFFLKNNISFYPDMQIKKTDEAIYQIYSIEVNAAETVTIEKIVTFMTSKDRAISQASTDAHIIASSLESYDQLLKKHIHAWHKLWNLADIHIESEGGLQKIIRFNIFHLLQTASYHSLDLDISIPARGLHGEAYRGHIFWDELFILPFYIFIFPDIARSLLLYRYRRLNMARYLAKKSGYQGAMYPWQSGSNGNETTQELHLNPRANVWIADYSCYQRHINSAIVYNIWQYYLATNDLQFISDYGAEIIFEIAKFWASIAKFNKKSGRYEINGVVGPDEYHEKYPDKICPGINNNAYTNIMAVWSIERAIEIMELLPQRICCELKEKLQIDENIASKWHDITTQMKIPFHDNTIISQFDGYEKLLDFNWKDYQEKYGNIERLDRILKAEGDSPDKYKASKQADVLMLFHLFSKDELCKIFDKLGYFIDEKVIQDNIEYYASRTSHGSTLSKAVFSSIYYLMNKKRATSYYIDTLNYDLTNFIDGTTAEGLHLGSMGISVSTIFYRFIGLTINSEQHKSKLCFSPNLPENIMQIKLNLQFHGQSFTIIVTQEKFEIMLHKGNMNEFSVVVNNHTYNLESEKLLTVNF